MLVLVLSLSALLGASAAEHPEHRGGWTIEPLMQSFLDAWNRHDARALSELFSDDGLLISPSGARVQGPASIHGFLTRKLARAFKATLRQSIDDVHFPSPDTAVVRGRYELGHIPLFLGFQTDRQGWFTFRLLHLDGRWKIVFARITH